MGNSTSKRELAKKAQAQAQAQLEINKTNAYEAIVDKAQEYHDDKNQRIDKLVRVIVRQRLINIDNYEHAVVQFKSTVSRPTIKETDWENHIHERCNRSIKLSIEDAECRIRNAVAQLQELEAQHNFAVVKLKCHTCDRQAALNRLEALERLLSAIQSVVPVNIIRTAEINLDIVQTIEKLRQIDIQVKVAECVINDIHEDVGTFLRLCQRFNTFAKMSLQPLYTFKHEQLMSAWDHIPISIKTSWDAKQLKDENNDSTSAAKSDNIQSQSQSQIQKQSQQSQPPPPPYHQ